MLIKSGSKGNSPLSPLNIIAGLLILAGVIILIIQSQTKSTPDSAQSQTAFKMSGQEYGVENLPHRYRQKYYEIANQAYKQQQQILSTAATEIYINQQMEETGETKDSVIKRLFNPINPTLAEVQAFYQQNRQRINVPFEQAKNQIALMMMTQQQQIKQNELLNNLAELGEYEFQVSPPTAPIITIDTLGYPSKGPENAAVTLIEFGDYQCGHCREAFLKVAKVLPEYKDSVRFVFMDFPINQSGISRKVAEGAQCALQQDKFWPFHNMAYERQSQLNEQSPLNFAKELKLDLTKFEQCLSDEATVAKVKSSAQQAVQSGVTGTPTFFLNGIKLSDQDRQRSFKELLDQAIEASKSS